MTHQQETVASMRYVRNQCFEPFPHRGVLCWADHPFVARLVYAPRTSSVCDEVQRPSFKNSLGVKGRWPSTTIIQLPFGSSDWIRVMGNQVVTATAHPVLLSGANVNYPRVDISGVRIIGLGSASNTLIFVGV